MDVPRGVEIRVLGPLEIVGPDGAAGLRALKERRLLAALLVQAGATLPSDVLVDALWGATPPRSANKLLQVYVSKLRKILPGGVRIHTRGSGYAVELDDGVLDATLFEQMLEEGRIADRGGNPALAASRFRRALALWRGPAYGDLAYEVFARVEAERLEELRVVATEERIQAELQLGRHAGLLPELLGLADATPLRERLQALTILALYRSGRQADALERYADLRQRLADELGLEPSAELQAMHVAILRHDPELDVVLVEDASPAGIPIAPDPLLGRERELSEVHDLLLRDDVRLLVLTGAGGSGKTRLAIEATHRVASSFANGAAFVGLASVHDLGLLVTTISSGLGIEPLPGDPLETLATALRPKELLLVLDNLEHLRDATPALVTLLSLAPRVTLLATSRVVLHLSGEHVYPVDPLVGEAAVDLFLDRARQADPRFDPDMPALDAVRRICERLDGLPLAIELAAGRIRMQTPAELLERLDRRLPVLTGGPRDLPARQQTLRGTLEWSLDLLDDLERRDVARLSVFAAGCTFEAAEAVCETTLERVSALVDQNLLVRSVGADGSRYAMLETVRELASERLEASDEAEGIRRRQAEHALRLAGSLGLSVDALGTGVPQRHDIALLEQDNMRAALDWAQSADPALGLALAMALEQFWVTTNPREGADRFETLLARAGELSAEVEARVLRDLGGSFQISGEWRRAVDRYEQSLELFERIGDEASILHLRCRLAKCRVHAGDLVGARAIAEQALALARAGGLRFQEADALFTLAIVATSEGDVESAFDLERESLEICRQLGGWVWGESLLLMDLADLSARLGRVNEAEIYGRESLEISLKIGSRRGVVFGLAALAVAARVRRDVERAGTLWGAIEAEEERSFLGSWPTYREWYASVVLSPASDDLDRCLEDGRRMTLEDVTAFALRGSGRGVSTEASPN